MPVAPKSPVMVSMGRSRLTKEGFIKEVKDRLYDTESGQWNGRFFVIRCNESQNTASGATATDSTGAPVIPMKKNLSIAPQTVSIANCAASWNAARRDKVFSVFLGPPYWLTGKLEEVMEFLNTLGFEIAESRLSNILLSPVKMLSLAPKHLLLHAALDGGADSAAGATAASGAAAADADKDATEIEPIGSVILDIATHLEGSLAQEAAEAAEAQATGASAATGSGRKAATSATAAAASSAAGATSPSSSRAKLSGTELFIQKLTQAKNEGGFVLDVTNWPRVVKTKSSTKNKHQLLSDLPIISGKFETFLQAMVSAGERDRLSFALRSANGKFDGQDLHTIYNTVANNASARPLSPVINTAPGQGLESPSVAAPAKKTRARRATTAAADSKSAATAAAAQPAGDHHQQNDDDDDSLMIPRKNGGGGGAAGSSPSYYTSNDHANTYDDDADNVYDDNGNDNGDDDDLM